MHVQRDDLEAWLGHVADELTPEQVDLLHTAVEEIHERWPDKDEGPERDAAMLAALEHIDGSTPLEKRGRALLNARTAEREAVVQSRQAAMMAVRDGMSESQAARESGLDRMTVRRMLGK